MINREYRCVAHDHEFESAEGDPENKVNPPCPFGCHPSFVRLEFRTAPSIRSPSTRVVDHFQRQLAHDYGMSDMRGDKDGSSVMSNTRTSSGGARKIYNPEQQTRWAPNLFAPQQGWAGRNENPEYVHNMPGANGRPNTTPMKPILSNAPPLAAKTVYVKQKGEK